MNMLPRNDEFGVILNTYGDILVVNNGVNLAVKIVPESADFIRKELAAVIAAATVLPEMLPSLARQKIEAPGISVSLDRHQTEMAHTVLQVLVQRSDDEIEADEAEDLDKELTATAQMSHELVTARS